MRLTSKVLTNSQAFRENSDAHLAALAVVQQAAALAAAGALAPRPCRATSRVARWRKGSE